MGGVKVAIKRRFKMNVKSLKNTINKITVSSFANYLKLNGWRKDETFPNKKLLVFEKNFDEGDTFQLVIPSKETFKDFIPKVEDAINNISIYEDKDINIILNELLSKVRDRNRKRIE